MIQLIPRMFLMRLQEHAQKLTHSQRYKLEEQVIEHNLLSKKNKLRIAKLRHEKEKRAVAHVKKKHHELAQKQKVLKFNDLHSMLKELENMKHELASIQDTLSKKEFHHYAQRIKIFEEIIAKKKEQIRKKQ